MHYAVCRSAVCFDIDVKIMIARLESNIKRESWRLLHQLSLIYVRIPSVWNIVSKYLPLEMLLEAAVLCSFESSDELIYLVSYV